CPAKAAYSACSRGKATGCREFTEDAVRRRYAPINAEKTKTKQNHDRRWGFGRTAEDRGRFLRALRRLR
ncbi:MAG TPA: hypothetical protein VMK05_07275, partial [Burkholderiales bacterium]|nr:hypothetical protein [Burkholderiales bacterium]